MPPKLRVTKLRRGIFFVGVIVLLTTLLFECVLRVFDPLGLSYFADGNRYFAELLVPSEGYGYIHRPNVEVSLRTMEITTNGQGFRWKEFPKTPSSNGTQVVILGDSIVMGWGLPIEQTFSTKLEQSNSSIHVLSAGVASWNTRTEYEWFKRVGVDYEPDVVVWVVTTNDVIPHDHSKLDRLQSHSMWRRILGQSFVAFAVRQFSAIARASNQVSRFTSTESAEWQDVEQALAGMARLCEQNNIQLVVVMYGKLDSEFAHSFYDSYRTELDRHGIQLLRFPDKIYDNTNSQIDAHPNDLGNSMMADWLLPLVKK